MSLWRDEKFLRLLAPTLQRFTQKSAHNFNFRCPLCGDSETNLAKARGYVFPVQDKLIFKCHNCSMALPFSALLKRQSRHLYDEYILERLKEDGRHADSPPERSPDVLASPVVRPDAQAFPVYPLSALTSSHPKLHSVFAYAKDERKLPFSAFSRLFATDQAHTWLLPLLLKAGQPKTDDERKQIEKKAASVEDGLPYLVQPLRLMDGTWYGAQLRPIVRKEFLTFRWAEDPLKVFGLDAWDPNKLTYIVEGPIDALFLPNALSVCGSDLHSGIHILEDRDIMKPSNRRVYVWDNEPRNKEIARHIRAAIKLNENVVIWPRNFPKDINDMVRAGIDVNHVLPKRTFFGLNAELEFSAWQRP